MAVFTELDSREVESVLARMLPGWQCCDLTPIASGIENSNWFVSMQSAYGSRQWVLTLCEMIERQALQEVVQLLAYLVARELPVPAPLAQPQGSYLFELAGKPALLVPRAAGAPLQNASSSAVAQVARFLSRLHQSVRVFPGRRPALRGASWIRAQADRLYPALDRADAMWLEQACERTLHFFSQAQDLPRGWGHFDLFIDNVLFDAGEISAVIDFYHACEDLWLLDLATFLNDWCWREGEGFDLNLLQEGLVTYHRHRPLTAAEQAAFADALFSAALRFWLSRQATALLPGYQQQARTGQPCKDPQSMRARMDALDRLDVSALVCSL